MYKSNNFLLPSKRQDMLRSFLYALLIASLLWIPHGTENVIASELKEGKASSFRCREHRNMTRCIDGVTKMRIEIPKQHNGVKVDIVTGDVADAGELRGPDDDFEVQQVLAAIAFVDRDTGEVIQGFDPAITVKVPYNRANVQAVGGVENLKLGFRNQDGRWVEFEDVEIQGNRRRGWLSVRLSGLEKFYSYGSCPVQEGRDAFSNLFEYNQFCLPSGFMSWGG